MSNVLRMPAIEKRQESFLEHSLSEALLEDIAEAEIAFDAVLVNRDPEMRKIARIHAKELLLRVTRELTVVAREIAKIIRANTIRYNDLVSAEVSLEERL